MTGLLMVLQARLEGGKRRRCRGGRSSGSAAWETPGRAQDGRKGRSQGRGSRTARARTTGLRRSPGTGRGEGGEVAGRERSQTTANVGLGRGKTPSGVLGPCRSGRRRFIGARSNRRLGGRGRGREGHLGNAII